MNEDPAEHERSLLETAREVLATYRDATAVDGGTACALRADGDVFTGVYVETTIGSAAVHAEAAAVADAVEAGSLPVETVVAVSHPGDDADASPGVISPCGTCRELIYDYGPQATVVVTNEGTPRSRPIADLLPDAPWFGAWED